MSERPSMDTSFASAVPVSLPTRPVRLIISEPVRGWTDAVKKQLEELVRLPTGWDGYAGEAVSLLNAYFALRLLEGVCGSDAPVPQIVPGSSGDLQIEWHTTRGDIELYVRAPNDVLAWHSNAQTGPDGEELALSTDFIAVARWLEDLEPSGAAAAAA
jgi:hypothetical protein